MGLRHIVVATDGSAASREAVRTGLAWAGRSGARISMLTVEAPSGRAVAGGRNTVRDCWVPPAESLRDLERSYGTKPGAAAHWPAIGLATRHGVPGVEIARFAEAEEADLVILGRTPRSAAARLLVGDTTDAVARRSRVPCLLVAGPLDVPGCMLVALDGTERGFTVLQSARRMAAGLEARLRLVTVEPARGESPPPPGLLWPVPRASGFARGVNGDAPVLSVRRGEVVPEILSEVQATRSPVLIVGYHRGGPPAESDAGSTSRRLAHLAPCAVLTIPL